MIWLIVFGLAFLIWRATQRPRVWRPGGRWPSQSPTPLPMPLPAHPDGCWYEVIATLWYSPSGRLTDQGSGQLRCLGDHWQWLGPHGTLWCRWEGILAIHGHPNGVLLHTTDLPPLVLTVPDNAQWHAWVIAWLAHDWVFDGTHWYPVDCSLE